MQHVWVEYDGGDHLCNHGRERDGNDTRATAHLGVVDEETETGNEYNERGRKEH